MLRSTLIASVLLSLSLAGAACRQADPDVEAGQDLRANRQASASIGPSTRVEVPKVEREGVWQPTADGTQIPLWPADIPLARPDSGDRPEATGNGSPTVGGRTWHWASYVTRPTMTIFRPAGRNTGVAMLVIPGGGFHAVATDLEGTEICDWVVQRGMTCAMLKYRTPQVWPRQNGRQRRPEVLLGLEDAQRAMSMLREQADAYGIDPLKIGVIGFSAGAYLVTNMSNTEARTYPPTDAADRQSPRPDFAIVAYTARVRDTTRQRNELEVAPWVTISPNAPPTLIIHAMNDEVDDVREPMAYALALNDAGVPVDMRLYAKGGHAFGMRPTADPITREWPGQVEQWLRSLGSSEAVLAFAGMNGGVRVDLGGSTMPYEAKTKPTPVSPEAFIDAVDHPGRREDAHAVLALLTEATGHPPVMWGPSIIGFGKYRYTYDSGHSGEAPLVGFSPRKANLVLYMAAYDEARNDFLSRLGKHKSGKGCIYLNRLADVDTGVIAEMAKWSMKTLKERHPD